LACFGIKIELVFVTRFRCVVSAKEQTLNINTAGFQGFRQRSRLRTERISIPRTDEDRGKLSGNVRCNRKLRHGQFRESEALRYVFEQVVERCKAEGLVVVSASAVSPNATLTDGCYLFGTTS
jgi:hypothetical protein